MRCPRLGVWTSAGTSEMDAQVFPDAWDERMPLEVSGAVAVERACGGLSGIVIEPNVGGGIPREQVFNSVRLFATEVSFALRKA